MSEESKVVTVALGVVEAIDALINSCLENDRGVLAKEIQTHIESYPA